MALTPDQPNSDKLAVRRAAEQDVLLREVDEAVRQDEAAEFAKRHGKTIIAALVVGLAAFGGWLWWQDYHEGQLDKGSEKFVQALDLIDAGSNAAAAKALDPIAQNGTPAASAGARMIEAGNAFAKGDAGRATTMYFDLADDGKAPRAMRDLAAIRGVSVNFDNMKPDDVIARLKPLATPGNSWFGSAGELVAMAYLKQGKKDLAGPLFASIAKDETAPKSLRSRSRQMAGMLGYDAVVDVDQVLAEQRTNTPAAGPAGQ